MASTFASRSLRSLAGTVHQEQVSTSHGRPHGLSAQTTPAERLSKRQCVRAHAAAAAQPTTAQRPGDGHCMLARVRQGTSTEDTEVPA